MRDNRSLTIATLLLAGPVFAVHVAKKWNLSFSPAITNPISISTTPRSQLCGRHPAQQSERDRHKFSWIQRHRRLSICQFGYSPVAVNYLSSALFNLSGEFSLALVFALFASFAVLRSAVRNAVIA